MTQQFRSHVEMNPANRAILSRWESLDIPGAWLVAGCLFQTVWNLQGGRPPGAGIKDYDIFYFDATDLSELAEAQAQQHAEALFGDLGIVVEVANQARVHMWYPGHFGRPYPELTSTEDGIVRFLVLETCLAVRPGNCFTPHGLDGLYRGTLTRNPLTPHEDLFSRKVSSYRERWSWLKVQETGANHVRPTPAPRLDCR